MNNMNKTSQLHVEPVEPHPQDNPMNGTQRIAATLATFAVVLLASGPALAAKPAQPTADQLLDAMDKLLTFETRTAVSVMKVIDSRRTRVYEMLSYGRGIDESAVEFRKPARDKGTKMLKKGDNMWIYMPRAERVQKISGHMLRQGMMGSDISYEDMMQSQKFRELYKAKVLGAEMKHGRRCWKVEAIARDKKVSYPKRLLWIDVEHLLPLEQELFALSGMKLKTWTMGDIRVVDGRKVAMRMELNDMLRKGSKTVVVTKRLKFGVKVPSEVFSRRWLQRKSR